MSARKFIALGTASQVPTRERNHNGYCLLWDNQGVLFDPGEGTQRQMIYAGVSVSQITKICITHFHGDHCLGLAGILQRLSLDRVSHTVEIHYPAYGRKYVDHLKNASIYYNNAKIKECPFDKAGVIAKDKHLSLSTLKLDHTVESWGYRLQEADSVTMLPEKLSAYGIKGPAVGQLKTRGYCETPAGRVSLAEVSLPKAGQSFAFVMDTRLCPTAIELARGVDLLVCESTYLASESADAKANGHLTAAQAAGIAKEAGARRLVLTHFSQRYPFAEAFAREARQIHADTIAVQDGDSVELPARG